VKNKISRDHVKAVASFAATMSVNVVVRTAIVQNIAPKNRLQSVELFIGAYTLGSLLAKPVQDHVASKIDETADKIDQIKLQVAENQKK
jgi:hypothetical protein